VRGVAVGVIFASVVVRMAMPVVVTLFVFMLALMLMFMFVAHSLHLLDTNVFAWLLTKRCSSSPAAAVMILPLE
ncbi:MAG TPA: hypothetical protein VKR81_10245, partial [Candidatus Binatia bacterium]|nr:hypothetical protein [Candidatus Binatia bacterium]